jgi:transposase
MTPEQLREIQDLSARGLSIRAIARRLGRNVKTIRRALKSPPQLPRPSKLDPFKDLAREKAEKGLFAPRILREIQERGYTGSISILKDYLRSVRGPLRQERRVVRRFETEIGKEGQMDWSPYRVPIRGVETVVHAFSMIVCFSRMQFLAFFRDERLPTLLHAHVEAFQFFNGFPHDLWYDNCTTISLGRLHGKTLFHPTFLQFSKHMGFEPFTCEIDDPDRKGKIERPFWYIENDFLKDRSFESWEDLNAQARRWLDTVANVRLHKTTQRVVREAFAQEQPLLIRLPQMPFPTDRRETRKVQTDGYISVDGSLYPVPAKFVGQYVGVRIYPLRVEITDAAGKTVIAHPVPDRPTRLPPLDAGPMPPPSYSRPVLESAFLARFGAAVEFLDGLKRRMNALTPIHLKQIDRLINLYGEQAVREAIERAGTYGNYSATAVSRILQKRFPTVVEEPPIPPVATVNPAAMGALDDVDSGSPTDYTLDSMEPTKGDEDASKEQE